MKDVKELFRKNEDHINDEELEEDVLEEEEIENVTGGVDRIVGGDIDGVVVRDRFRR